MTKTKTKTMSTWTCYTDQRGISGTRMGGEGVLENKLHNKQRRTPAMTHQSLNTAPVGGKPHGRGAGLPSGCR
jgi:hypothetical protein